MTIDISRKTFDPSRHIAWTTTLQGRVATDAPINEDRTLRDRHQRAAMVDLAGRCGYPALLPYSFLIGLSGGSLTIGPGRYYVDGHQAENFGTGADIFDDVLSERRQLDPTPYDQQPFGADTPPPPQADGTYLVYVDVWQRDLTTLEDDTILDPAIATDAFARRQTVWQVRAFGPVADDVDCETEDGDIAGWPDLIRPSDARLTTRANPDAADPDPCLLPPGAEYRGTDNRTYRFEVHSIAGDGTPMVKFSRTHATVATRILVQPQGDVLEVVEVARDDFLRFNSGDWVEITSEARLLAGRSGTMARVLSVDDPSNTVTLENPLPAGALVLVGAGPDADQTLRPVLRRWDQSGELRDENGIVLVDLDLVGADGLIPAPTDGTFIHLEDGVEAALTLADAAGSVRVHDNWTFIARYADSSVQALTLAPPDDFHHHYCRLAMATAVGGEFTEVIEDCRDPLGEDEDCCCTITVIPGDSIQDAIDDLPPDIGGCVCLKAGLHVVPATVVIARPNVTLVGECQGVTVTLQGSGAVLRVEAAAGIDVSSVAFRHRNATSGGGVVEVLSSLDVTFTNCAFSAERGTLSSGVLVRSSADVAVRECRFTELVIGVMTIGQSQDVTIADNSFALGGENFVGQVAVLATGAIGPVRVKGNTIGGALSGISINDDPSGATRLSLAQGSIAADNDISLAILATNDPTIAMHGVDVAADHCVVGGNRVRLAGSGRVGIRATGAGTNVVENSIEVDLNANDDGFPIGILVGVPEDAPHQTEGITVAHNSVSDAAAGVVVRGASEVIVDGNDLRLFPSGLSTGVLAEDCVNLRVSGNGVDRADFGVLSTSGRHTAITGNTISRCRFGLGLNQDFAATLADNVVTEAAEFGLLTLVCLGQIRIDGNRFANCGSTGTLPFAIGGFAILGEWHVSENEVINTGLPVDGAANAAPAVGIFGILILEAHVAHNHVTYSQIGDLPDGREDRALVLQGLIEVATNLGNQAIRFGFPCQIADNKFVGKGLSALVELRETPLTDSIILRFERVFFTHNYCNHFDAQSTNTTATVLLDGAGGVVMGNQIKALDRSHPSMNLGNMPGTVVGNLTAGAIINHPNFPTPQTDYNSVL